MSIVDIFQACSGWCRMMCFIECFRECSCKRTSCATHWPQDGPWDDDGHVRPKMWSFFNVRRCKRKSSWPAVSWMRTACTRLRKLTKQDLYQLKTLLIFVGGSPFCTCLVAHHTLAHAQTLLCISLYNRLSEGMNLVVQWCGLALIRFDCIAAGS
jgi:hypothetical protein